MTQRGRARAALGRGGSPLAVGVVGVVGVAPGCGRCTSRAVVGWYVFSELDSRSEGDLEEARSAAPRRQVHKNVTGVGRARARRNRGAVGGSGLTCDRHLNGWKDAGMWLPGQESNLRR